MTTILSEGESIRRAVKWISDCREENPSGTVSGLIRDAIARFDLSPKDAEFLMRFYQGGSQETGAASCG